MEEGLSRGVLYLNHKAAGDRRRWNLCYLVVMVRWAAGVQTSQEALGLLLDAGRSWHGQQHSSQFLSCHLIFLLLQRTNTKHSSAHLPLRWCVSLISRHTCSSLPSLHGACNVSPFLQHCFDSLLNVYLTFKEHFTYLHKKSHFEIYGLLHPAVSVNEVTLQHKNPTSNKCKCQLSF